MKFNFLNMIFVFLLTATSCLSNAGLITDHDGYVTDSVTGWQWLDASYTDRVTYNDVLARTTSGDLLGWEIASTSEVLELLLHQNNNVAFQAPGTDQLLDSALYDNFKELVQMLGIGSHYGDGGDGYGYLNGMTTDKTNYDDRDAARTVQFGWVDSVRKGDRGFLRDDSWGTEDNDATNYFVHTWLVKKTDVPEPSTLAIFTLGLIGFASRRFNKQS